MHTLNGSCNCGAIRYRVSGEIRSIVNCHCNMCRKINGSAFSTYVAVADDDFEIVNGSARSHKVSELAEKHFCGTCGTPLFNSSARYAGLTILHLGSIDDSLDMEPRVNIYCESRLDWLHKLPEIPDLDRGF
jgi:hypothetical protein